MNRTDDHTSYDTLPQLSPLARRLMGASGMPTSSTLGRLGRTATAALRGGGMALGRKLPFGAGGTRVADAAENLTINLGTLKAISMKVGQILSYIDLDLPPEVRGALATLQTYSQPLPFPEIRRTIHTELPQTGGDLTARLSNEPVAAASIAQVHRGTLPDGTAVAVKVRYPGIAKMVERDFGPAAVGTHLASMIFRDVKLRGFVDEARARFKEECDLRRELDLQQELRHVFDEHPLLTIPKPYPDYSSEGVLTMAWANGRRLEDFLRGEPDQEARNRAGMALYDFYVGSLYRHGLHNTDPHPGNYLFQADGRVTMLDFGACHRVSGERVMLMKQLSAAALSDDAGALRQAMEGLGVVERGQDYDPEAVKHLTRALFAPMLREGHRRFNLDELRELREVSTHRRSLVKLQLPADFLFLFRARFGLMSILARLGSEANWHRVEQETAAAPANTTGGGGQWAATPYHVIVEDPGTNLIALIRKLRDATGRSLAELKEQLDAGPLDTGGAMRFEDAEALAAQLRELGATVDIREKHS